MSSFGDYSIGPCTNEPKKERKKVGKTGPNDAREEVALPSPIFSYVGDEGRLVRSGF